ncbi:S46 family peptidase [Arenimonas oryziterrae]|nr:S46 family peptidase [Arenimonas oryziterrae]
MWVPQQLPEIAGPLKQAGLKLDAKQLADLTGQPMGAVVAINGCTASFVSPQGLIATNHHCAYGSIQLNSTPERNLIRDGFNAAQLGDEVSAGPNARVYVMDQITDVTAQVLAEVAPTLDGLARQKAIETAQKALVAACEAEPGYRCTVYSFFGGLQYRLFRQIELKDVRLVYAPPASIGNYGGEVDNWMWPRHTGDFSLIRAYVGKDGKPAAFSADNVPYQPKHFLPFTHTPLRPGDFVMVAGFPGSTNRYALADEFDNTAGWSYPTVGAHLKHVRDLVHAAGEKNPDIAIKYASTVKSWENVLKNYDGQLAGFARVNAAASKRKEENALLAWLATRGDAGKPALEAHDKIVALIAQTRSTRERDLVVGQIVGLGTLGSARSLYRLSIEKAKPNAERSPGYQDRDLPRIEGGLKELQQRYHPDMEKQLMTYWLSQYIQLPASQRIAAVDTWLGGNDAAAVTRAVDTLYAGSQMGDVGKRLEWFKADKAAFEASTDPMIRLAVALTPTLMKLEDEGKARTGENLRYRPVYLAAVQDYKRSKGEGVYPDANSSLRITYGNVTGYGAKGSATFEPFTTAEGMAAKATGQDPFNAPQAILDAVSAKRYGSHADAKLGTLPVNFLSNLDITGGNSGSPVMNARGELVGLAFDGNWESVSSNWVFDGTYNRMISVDSRYITWIMEQVYPAPRLLKEIGM